MSEYLYRVMYTTGEDRWHVHTSGKGTSVYTTVGAARGAITQFRKRDTRYHRSIDTAPDYKIQRVPLTAWEDLPID